MTTTETAVKPVTTANGTKPAWEGGDVTVFEAVRRVIRDMAGIGKNQRNKEQGYNFRGIDDVLKVVHPLLAEHGVVIAPDVVERLYEERINKSGTVGHCAHLHVRYQVYGPDGSSIALSSWGEGLDYGDKATNKAMTGAFKYMLFQLLAVSDPSDDGDHETPEAGTSTATRPSADWRPVSSAPQMGPSHYSDVPCPQPGCTGKLVQRDGTHGEFVSCTMYKSCGIKPIDGTLEEYQAREREMADVRDVPELPDPSLPDADYIKATWKKVTSNIRLDAFGTGDLVRCLSQNSKKVWVLTDQAAEDLRSEPSDRVRAVADFFRTYLARQAAG